MKILIYAGLATTVVGLSFIFVRTIWDSEADLKRNRELYRLEKYRYEFDHPDEIPFMSYYEWLIDQD